MILREVDFSSDLDRRANHRLRLETRFICALYERCLTTRTATNDIWKVEVKLVCQNPPDPESRIAGGVAVVGFETDAAALLETQPLLKRNRQTLQLIQKAMIRACEAFDWPKEPFKEASECVINHNFVNEWIWKKSKWSPNRKIRAEVSCEHRADTFRMQFQVRDRHDTVQLLKTVEALPDEFDFTHYLGKIEWESDGQVKWVASDGETVYEGKPGEGG